MIDESVAKGKSWGDRAMGRRGCHSSLLPPLRGFAHILARTQERMEQQREVSGVELQKFSSSEKSILKLKNRKLKSPLGNPLGGYQKMRPSRVSLDPVEFNTDLSSSCQTHWKCLTLLIVS